MKILFVCAGWGSWIPPLANMLELYPNTKVHSVYSSLGKQKQLVNEKIINLDLPNSERIESMSKNTFLKFNKIIREIAPDIIHIHGTETNLAQLQNYITDIPIVISIQGILKGCLRHNTAFLTSEDVRPYKSLKNIFGQGGLYHMEKQCIKRVGDYESDIFANGKYFFGRTDWDHAYVKFSNPNAHYFQGDELLRSAFYKSQAMWNLDNVQRHSIFMSSGFNPLKGMHLAIKAVAMLKNYYPDVVLKIPGMPLNILNRRFIKERLFGEEYISYVKSLICDNGLQSHVEFMSRLSAEDMASEMIRTHVFLSPSTVDNSPNIVGEATMVGTPIVITPVGGVMSFMENNHNCLFAASGDSYAMAYQIMKIFEDDNLAKSLSSNAVKTASERHDLKKVTEQYIRAYNEIIEIHRHNL